MIYIEADSGFEFKELIDNVIDRYIGFFLVDTEIAEYKIICKQLTKVE